MCSKNNAEDVNKVLKENSSELLKNKDITIKKINWENKAKNIIGLSKVLLDKYESKVPKNLELLEQLPGVGRKTASVLLAVAFDTPAIAVDTHCRRVSQRLGLTIENNPEKVEHDLQELYSKELWGDITRLFIWHGRYTCKSRTPLCQECVLPDMCPWYLDMIA